HSSKDVRDIAKTLIESWKKMVDEWVMATKETVVSKATPESIKPSFLNEEEEGLPSPPLDDLAFFYPHASLELSDQFFDGIDDAADNQPSGAYIFHPNDSPPTIVSRSIPIKVIRGSLVDEVHHQFNPWIYQVTRLYKDKEHAEFEFIIGPIPIDDGAGKEVITRITANMATNKVLYTDSNGRDFLKRVRKYKEDWPRQVTQPVAGNYYPLNLRMYATNNKIELSMLIDRATGGA
ncbi:alpha-mannosidase, partial [Tanacetum coccineum]